MEQMRLQKYLSECGVASRRAAEGMIAEGRVAVDGVTVSEMGFKVTGRERITVDGKPVKPERNRIYIMMNKPVSVLSSVSDDRGRKCVVDLIDGLKERVYPVGRLDYDTSGLLLLTNDGDFTKKMTHPSSEIWKTYEAVVRGEPNEGNVRRFAEGLELDDGPALPALLSVIGHRGSNAVAEIRIREGRNRQVRRMMEAIKHPVLKLKRVGFGTLELDPALKPGAWRYLTDDELRRLAACAENPAHEKDRTLSGLSRDSGK